MTTMKTPDGTIASSFDPTDDMIVTTSNQHDDRHGSSPGNGDEEFGRDFKDDASSVQSTSKQSVASSSSTQPSSVGHEGIVLSNAKWLTCSKTLVFIVLLIATATSSFVVYTLSRQEEDKAYETRFKDVANSVHDVAELNAKGIVETYEAVAMQMTAFFQMDGVEWPYVSMDTFEAQAKQLEGFTDTNSVGIIVLVKEVERTQYEEYIGNHTGWVEAAHRTLGDDTVIPFSPTIFKSRTGGLITETDKADDQYTDLLAPFRHVTYRLVRYAYNLDALRAEPTKSVLENIFDLKTTVFSSVNNLDRETFRNDRDWPSSFLGVPIYDSVFEDERTVKAVLNANVNWHKYFQNVVTEGIDEVYLVISNTCEQEFTYLIDGPNVTYLGAGDLHESIDNGLEETYNFKAFKSLKDCEFTMRVYPSSGFYDTYHTFQPIQNTLLIIGTFFITAVVFLLYDFLVERRQKYVMSKANRSDAIISSLFPASVKDRLMGDSDLDPKARKAGDNGKLNTSSMIGDVGGVPSLMNIGSGKFMPIADLFPDVTVMFGDIVNFTAWSSMREPSQVFVLLETLYASFDKLAKKLKVFKVETVGDCYVACAGLPEPTDQHAIIMARFAKMCVAKLRIVVRELAVSLGPDTGDLTMRFGLHSGPVTAGVLRGEKSRFQLFGDTVNTASRIEALGVPNQIQVSQETADALVAVGKKSWIVPRKDRIRPKGKGELQTYWIVQRAYGDEGSVPESIEHDLHRNEMVNGPGSDSANDMGSPPTQIGIPNQLVDSPNSPNINDGRRSHSSGSAPGKVQRLLSGTVGNAFNDTKANKKVLLDRQLEVQWNADVLKTMLKRIVAMRDASQMDSLSSNSQRGHKKTKTAEPHLPKQKGTVLDEVKEIIELPSQSIPYKQDPSAVELSPAVISQVEDFVDTVSQMYRQNPFHSFSHASHVVQSTVKLLSRIVRREAIDYDEMKYTEQSGDALHKFTFGITSDPITQFACVLAALIHDVDHTGLPNAQLVKEKTRIAQQYNNKSVAEQNSLDLAWDLLMEPRYKEMRECIYGTQEELTRFRQLLVNAVMATDIMDKELGTLRKARWAKAFDQGSVNPSSSSPSIEKETEDANRMATIVIEHLIQASDVSHTMQHWHVYQKWNERLFHEMYAAYKEGRAEKDPSVGWYKGELGFFDFYVIPLAKKLKECGVFGVFSDEYLQYATANRKEWEVRGEETVANYIKKYEDKGE